MDVAQPVRDQGGEHRAHAGHAIPKTAPERLLSTGPPEGDVDGKGRGNASFCDAQEEAIHHQPSIVGDGSGAHHDDRPEEDADRADLSSRVALSQKGDRICSN